MRRVVRIFHPTLGSHAHVGLMIRLGLSELGYEVRDAMWHKADIAVLDPFTAVRRPVRGCLYTAIEGLAPGIEGKKLAGKVVVPSSFAFSMLPQAEYIVPHGVMPCIGREEKDYDFAVSFQTYSHLEYHMFRKNIPLLSVLSNLGLTICTNAATGVKCDAFAEPEEVYKRAKYLLFTSFSEGFGLPAAEAMACGTPVVYLATGGLDTCCSHRSRRASACRSQRRWHAALPSSTSTPRRTTSSRRGLGYPPS